MSAPAVDLAKNLVKYSKFFNPSRTDTREGAVTLINTADLYVALGHSRFEDIRVTPDIGEHEARLRGQWFNPVAPEGRVDHLTALKNLVAGESNDCLLYTSPSPRD